MPSLHRISVGAVALFLAGVLACDDGGRGSNPQGPPPNGGVDTTPPQTIADLTLAYRPDTRDVLFAWTAPRDDDATNRVARYDLRYSLSFPFDWDRSVTVSDPPAPAVEGTPQTYALAGAPRGRDLFVAARTYDGAGNPSAIGPVTHLRVPGIRFEAICQDVLTLSPVEGLQAIITAGASWNLTTGADGVLLLDEINGGTLGIRVETGSAPNPYHAFQRTVALTDDLILPVAMIPVVPAGSALYDNTLQIVLEALVVAGPGRVLKRWHAYPIPWHAPDFVNPQGLDYGALTRQAAARWNERTGIELFVETAAPPASGVTLAFLPRSVMGAMNGVTEHTDDADGYPLRDTIKIVDDFSDGAILYTILMHEFGHTIRLGHLPAGFIMYAGQPLPSDITDDEVLAVQLMLALPNGTDLAFYDASSPAR